jgi:hypothetical protein
MFTIHRRGRWEIVARSDNGRFTGGASLSFVRWMHERVPSHQLSPEQAALVKWYDEYKNSDEGKNETPE